MRRPHKSHVVNETPHTFVLRPQNNLPGPGRKINCLIPQLFKVIRAVGYLLKINQCFLKASSYTHHQGARSRFSQACFVSNSLPEKLKNFYGDHFRFLLSQILRHLDQLKLRLGGLID